MHPVYKHIKEFREVNRFSMADMADRLGISASSYFQLEKGNSKVTIERLEEIAKIFNVNVFALLIGLEELNKPDTKSDDRYNEMKKEMEEFKRQMKYIEEKVNLLKNKS